MKEKIDFHTHFPCSDPNIINVYIPGFENLGPSKNHIFCLGIHPWEIGKNPSHQLKKLDEVIRTYQNDKLFFGLGETGIDKIKTSHASVKLQEDIFKAQIEIAKKYKVKTLVLHCVRSYQEIYNQLKSLGFKGNLLFHAFEGNSQVYNQFEREWKTYISLSQSILTKTKTLALLTKIKPERILIETDANREESITDTFNTLVNILGITQYDLLELHHQSLRLLRQN